MANATHRIFKSAQIGAVHNQSCEADTALDMPELAIDVKDPEQKQAALDVIAAELNNNWDDVRTPEMTDEDVEASVKAEAEEIYQAWFLL